MVVVVVHIHIQKKKTVFALSSCLYVKRYLPRERAWYSSVVDVIIGMDVGVEAKCEWVIYGCFFNLLQV